MQAETFLSVNNGFRAFYIFAVQEGTYAKSTFIYDIESDQSVDYHLLAGTKELFICIPEYATVRATTYADVDSYTTYHVNDKNNLDNYKKLSGGGLYYRIFNYDELDIIDEQLKLQELGKFDNEKITEDTLVFDEYKINIIKE
jgi:hypothetical protein